jgi:hypothetical protein
MNDAMKGEIFFNIFTTLHACRDSSQKFLSSKVSFISMRVDFVTMCVEMAGVEHQENEPESYLPLWLLDMKRNISNSKQLYSQTNQRIESLRTRVESLGEKIDEVRPKRIEIIGSFQEYLIHQLPLDTIIVIVRFLDLKSLIFFGTSSKLLQQLFNNSELWSSYFKDLYPYFKLPNLHLCKGFILEQAQAGVTAIKFVRLMNSNRTLSRTRSFESHSTDFQAHKVETMTKDFRSFALLGLRALSSITCLENHRILPILVEEGVIRVLVSLLSNESSLVQQCSCDIISDMLSWESLTFRRLSSDDTDLRALIVSSQLQSCDGRRQLLSLLTSPSAAVVLSQTVRHDHPYQNEATLQITNKATASVQGLANKSASRALVNYFSSEDPILSPNRESAFLGALSGLRSEENKGLFDHDLEPKLPMAALSENIWGTATRWKFMYFHRSGFLKGSHDIWILFSDDGQSLQGRGIDEIGPFLLKGIADSGLETFSWYLDKYYLHSNFLESNLEPLHMWIQNMENIWLPIDEFWLMGRKGVCHVGYRSSQFLPVLAEDVEPSSHVQVR